MRFINIHIHNIHKRERKREKERERIIHRVAYHIARLTLHYNQNNDFMSDVTRARPEMRRGIKLFREVSSSRVTFESPSIECAAGQIVNKKNRSAVNRAYLWRYQGIARCRTGRVASVQQRGNSDFEVVARGRIGRGIHWNIHRRIRLYRFAQRRAQALMLILDLHEASGEAGIKRGSTMPVTYCCTIAYLLKMIGR